MLLDTFKSKERFWLTTVFGAVDGGLQAFRGDLVVRHGELKQAAGKRNPPEAGLLAADPLVEARALELTGYAVGKLHGQAFAGIFTTETFSPNPDEHEASRARGRETVVSGLDILDAALPEESYAIRRLQHSGRGPV